MRDKLIINDVHLGVERMAGTTPASQAALQAYLQTSFHDFIMKHLDKDLIIGGDLFDAFEVSLATLVTCYVTLSMWVEESRGGVVYLQDGNHDVGKRDDKPSSFAALADILIRTYPGRVYRIRGEVFTIHDMPLPIYLVPHCMNQTLFEAEIDKLQDVPGGIILFHANCMSPYAEHSDHSLNVPEDTLSSLSRHHMVLFAHEHPHRVVNLGHGDVHVLGNQWPSSIADCLPHAGRSRDQDRKKFAHVIHNVRGSQIVSLEYLPTWDAETGFADLPWKFLGNPEIWWHTPFIRVTGTVMPHEAADAVNAVARFRQVSQAFVIANDVKVATNDAEAKITELNVQSIRSFDVMAALLDLLEPAERDELKSIMEEE